MHHANLQTLRRIIGALMLLMAIVSCQADSVPAEPRAAATTSSLFAPATEAPDESTQTESNADQSTEENQVVVADGQILVQVDVDHQTHVINPHIYGLSGGDIRFYNEMGATVGSWGGNPATRYNYQIGNAWNTASDWFYTNVDYNNTGNAAAKFLARHNETAVATRLVVPTLGWIAKDSDQSNCSFPEPDGSCGNANGADCNNPRVIADPTDTSVESTPEMVTEWIRSLLVDEGLTIDYIAMDNEPELWGMTHYDVHPDCPTYEEILDKYLTYATALREVAPDVLFGGPVACCWYEYWALAPGPADAPYQAYLPWFLDQLYAHDQQVEHPTIDVLDVHFYPQTGVFNNDIDPDTNALRLRSTRSLWDPHYVDESWINTQIAFIPRMQEIIDEHYPGLMLGITEWNFGADNHINGALAIADVLGIFGREDVDMAAYWRNPEYETPGYFAFRMYTNFDGEGGRFGDLSIPLATSRLDNIANYAALDSQTGNLHIMLINKQPSTSATIVLQVDNMDYNQEATLYRYGEARQTAIQSETITLASTDATLTLPPYSITLLVLSPTVP